MAGEESKWFLEFTERMKRWDGSGLNGGNRLAGGTKFTVLKSYS